MERIDLGPCEGVLFRDDPDRMAVILPGRDYPPTAPLLWYAAEAFSGAGWSVLAVSDRFDGDDARSWVEERAVAALEQAGDAKVVVVSKSLSSLVAPLAAARSLPGVWLTPLLSVPEVAEAMATIRAPGLAVGAVNDPTWDVRSSTRLHRMEVLQIADGNHALQVPGDPLRSISILARVTERIQAFARRLG